MNSLNLPKDKKIVKSADIVWEYMKMNHALQSVDIIFVLGSRDDRVASYAAELYARGISNYILVSGGVVPSNDLVATKWKESEAEHFAKIMIRQGVPADSIILETKATSTGGNILLSYKELIRRKLEPRSLLLIHKPYIERRTYAAFMKQWPGLKESVLVSSPPTKFEDYFNDDQPFDKVVNIMVGDLQRIAEYPALGYQIYQKIPDTVLSAYKFLIKNGFYKHLIQH